MCPICILRKGTVSSRLKSLDLCYNADLVNQSMAPTLILARSPSADGAQHSWQLCLHLKDRDCLPLSGYPALIQPLMEESREKLNKFLGALFKATEERCLGGSVS